MRVHEGISTKEIAMNDVDALVSEPTRSAWNGPAQGAALSLSGGGFRAMLFHT
jgi:hypothetical protein